ncbi:tryptophan transporter [Clostridium sp. BJN0001]|uniref:tryptophan transporter n=1 Tax=Clostridium sp. BJN0001 TaxID=2930219 RepID=UPI001FD35AA1|nr:tryptophan transporter [Clostridium sp. BJN0001]
MEKTINTRKMVTNAILIAIGALLHLITPLTGLPMQPDLYLAMLFIIMIYNRDYKTTLICGIVVGIFAALTTKTPMGQIPNILDKIVTCNVMYVILNMMRNKVSKNVQVLIIMPIGTILSGTVFITALMQMGGVPVAQLSTLFIGVVAPTAVLNFIFGFILYKVIERTIKVTGTF